MTRLIVLSCFILITTHLCAKKIVVRNSDELKSANKNAQPGDTVILNNGTWNDIIIQLNCSGTLEQPIVFKAATRGKVVISGKSQLRIGGNYIVVDGLLFTNGYTPSGSDVIEFRISSKELANNCRVTNCVVNDFNKPKRMEEDQWVSFYGKNNRLDHCGFYNKKNMGVLLAVILDDERSRENFHSIDHNHFGIRPPLASNGGEIIRVGVSQHATFNSNTQITDNFFEYCDGETEVVSIKSCKNIVSNNVFKECQGSVVLRHGDDNTVSNNLFLGNGKEATGGVRVINKGQWVVNNFFYKCRGETFRSPLAIMNGIPNSPANRYVQVTDAVILNNTFVDCAPISFGEGSDAERTLPPDHVLFARNIFYNTKDSIVFRKWDDIKGLKFSDNKVNRLYKQSLPVGFEKAVFSISKVGQLIVPVAADLSKSTVIDSLMQLDKERLRGISDAPGFSDIQLAKDLYANAMNDCGANWFSLKEIKPVPVIVACKTTGEIYKALAKQTSPTTIRLTGSSYTFNTPLIIHGNVHFTGNTETFIDFKSGDSLSSLFMIEGKGNLLLSKMEIRANGLKTFAFVRTDTFGSSAHFNFKMQDVLLMNLTSCSYFLYVHKSTMADSIIVRNSKILGFTNGVVMAEEKDDKGYYNTEKLYMVNNQFYNGNGSLLNLYRGGNDESTLGPDLVFSKNVIRNCHSENPLIQLTGVQKTKISDNLFYKCNPGKMVITYKDIVRARHLLSDNTFRESGGTMKNNFVTDRHNHIQ